MKTTHEFWSMTPKIKQKIITTLKIKENITSNTLEIILYLEFILTSVDFIDRLKLSIQFGKSCPIYLRRYLHSKIFASQVTYFEAIIDKNSCIKL